VTQLTLYHNLRNVAREAEAVCAATVGEYGLNAMQYTALSVIGDYGPIHASSVARHMWSAEASVMHAVATLRGRGYIIREEGRGVAKPLLITQQGLTVLDKCTRAMAAAEQHLRRFINPDTITGLADAHTKLLDWYDIHA